MFNVYDRYLMRQLFLSTFVIAGSLSVIILLTQSLRLIELVLESNASTGAFMAMMALSLPRFIEAVLPASVLISVLFVLHRLSMDSEMIVLRASGASPWRMAKPVIGAGIFLSAFLLLVSLWISPLGISNMQNIQKEVRAQYSHLLFREGVFNSVGRNLTAYVRARSQDGQLIGLMVHDTRGPSTVTVVARSGHIVSDKEGQKIIVYDGSRQEKDLATGKFSRLDFKQYTLDIPSGSTDTSERWREPDERTITELLDPLLIAAEAPEDRAQFRAEVHRRITTPLLMMSFALMAAVTLLQGSFSRGGQMHLIISASVAAIILQGLYLVAYNMAKKSAVASIGLYAVSLIPVALALYFLSARGERVLGDIGRALNALRHGKRRP